MVGTEPGVPALERLAKQEFVSHTTATTLQLAAAAQLAMLGYREMIVFSDSQADVGNVNIATGGAVAGEPYDDGRWSNGPLIV